MANEVQDLLKKLREENEKHRKAATSGDLSFMDEHRTLVGFNKIDNLLRRKTDFINDQQAALEISEELSNNLSSSTGLSWDLVREADRPYLQTDLDVGTLTYKKTFADRLNKLAGSESNPFHLSDDGKSLSIRYEYAATLVESGLDIKKLILRAATEIINEYIVTDPDRMTTKNFAEILTEKTPIPLKWEFVENGDYSFIKTNLKEYFVPEIFEEMKDLAKRVPVGLSISENGDVIIEMKKALNLINGLGMEKAAESITVLVSKAHDSAVKTSIDPIEEYAKKGLGFLKEDLGDIEFGLQTRTNGDNVITITVPYKNGVEITTIKGEESCIGQSFGKDGEKGLRIIEKTSDGKIKVIESVGTNEAEMTITPEGENTYTVTKSIPGKETSTITMIAKDGALVETDNKKKEGWGSKIGALADRILHRDHGRG